jgi:ribosomal protein L23
MCKNKFNLKKSFTYYYTTTNSSVNHINTPHTRVKRAKMTASKAKLTCKKEALVTTAVGDEVVMFFLPTGVFNPLGERSIPDPAK